MQIGVDICHQARELRRCVIRQRNAVGNTEGQGAVKRPHLATLADIGAETAQKRTDLRHGLPPDRKRRGGCGAELLATTESVVVFGEVFPDQGGLQLLGRLPADTQAARPEVAAVDIIARMFVEGIAVALGPFARDAHIQPIVHDRDIDHSLEALFAVVAEFGTRHGFKLVGGACAGEVYDAGGCISAVKRSLRPAQDFDLRNVVKFLLEEMVADERYVVEGHSHRGIGGDRDRLCPNAANLDAVAGKIGLGEIHVRNLFD